MGAQATCGGVFADDAKAETVEGRNVHIADGVAGELADAGEHFAGGFVGEGEGEDVGGRDAAVEHVGNTVGDGAGFAGAGAGKHEDGAVDGFNGAPLRRVEIIQ